MTAPIRITPEYELYRVITDYEALQDGFLDRIEDLDTTMALPSFADGAVQKLLTKNSGRHVKETRRSSRKASLKRTFGWESLRDMLRDTGLALVLVIDDERFAPIKDQLVKRKRRDNFKAKPLSKHAIAQIISGTFANHGRRGAVLRHASLSPSQRKKIAKAAARIRWRKRPPHTGVSPAE